MSSPLTDDPKTETSRLLPLAEPDFSKGEFSGQSVESAMMEATTHNDPVAKREDKEKLYGSTLILHNEVVSHSTAGANGSLRKATEAAMRLPAEIGGVQERRPSFADLYQNQRRSTVLFLEKVKHDFFEDASKLAEGTIPQSIVLAFVIGTACGFACWIYYSALEYLLELFWKILPEKFVEGKWSERSQWLWIPLVSFGMQIFIGLTVVYMGEPGDLPYTISRVHGQAYIPTDHVMPMVFASMFSIIAGGSLGPEAPLVAICGAIGGFISRRIFRQRYVNVVRKHTLMGMAAALAAFFGVPMGGSLFALEVCSRFGVEYFEHLIESIFCGEICLVVFRSLSGLSISPIWNFTAMNGRLVETEPLMVLIGGLIGLVGAFMAYIFATFHWTNMSIFAKLDLLDNSRAVYRALFGGFFVVLTGILVPHTMFWGEDEIQVVGNLGPTKDLPHIWPPTGVTGFEMNSAWTAFVMGMTKLAAISFTVAGGFRGGYIFPLMCSGAAFGRVIYAFFPFIPLQICVLCMAAGMNVAITRTSLASTLILAFLPGEPCALPPILMASLCSLFATAYLPFIKSQITRSDLDHSLFHDQHIVGGNKHLIDEDDDDDDDDDEH